MVSHRDPPSVSFTSFDALMRSYQQSKVQKQTYYSIAVRGEELHAAPIGDGPIISPNS